jgi:hypothetical protein
VTLPLPDPRVDQLPWDGERQGVQRNFDRIAQQFPLGPQHLQDDAVTTAKIADDAVGTDQIATLPAVRARRSSAQAIANNTITVVEFNAEDYDTAAQHDNATNPGRLTCVTAGLYSITANISWAANATGVRMARIRFNGAATMIAAHEHEGAAAANFTQLNLTGDYRLAAGQYVEVQALQVSGGNLDINADGANASTAFSMKWIGP